MSDKRIPLVVFSGGIDSTLVLLTELSKSTCDTMYVKWRQSEAKIGMELEARRKIFELIANDENILNVQADYVVRGGECLAQYYQLNQHDKDGREIDLIPNMPFPQPFSWLAHAVSVINPKHHSKLVMGYITGDQAMVIRHELEMAWKYLQLVCRPADEPLPIEFPLKWRDKKRVIQEYAPEFSGYLEHTWYCETPDEVREIATSKTTHIPCGRCKACENTSMWKREIDRDRQALDNLPKLEDVPPPSN